MIVIFKNIKNKDTLYILIACIIIGLISFKIIENYIYFFDIIRKLISLLVPVFYGFIIAYILNPVTKLLKRKFKLKEGSAILLSYAILIGIIAIVLIYFVPTIINNVIDIIGNVPSYISEIQKYIDYLIRNNNIKDVINNTGTYTHVNNIISQFGNMVVTILEGLVSYVITISSQLIKVFLGLLISIYVLIDKDRIIRETKKILFITIKEKKAKKLIEMVKIYNNMIGAYIGIKALDSTIIGFMALILLTIFRSEYALLLAIIVGVTNMIPYFGPFIGEIIGFLFNVFVSPTKALIIFFVLLCLQMFDGWYLDPKLIGNRVGVRPLYIIIAVLIGGGFFGAIGMLLASPTAATIKVYYDRIMLKNKEIIKNI